MRRLRLWCDSTAILSLQATRREEVRFNNIDRTFHLRHLFIRVLCVPHLRLVATPLLARLELGDNLCNQVPSTFRKDGGRRAKRKKICAQLSASTDRWELIARMITPPYCDFRIGRQDNSKPGHTYDRYTGTHIHSPVKCLAPRPLL